jgi:putative transposase
VNEVDNRLKEILLKVVQETKSEMIEMETMPDHVHILVEVDPQFGIHRLVKRMKATSANILRKEFPYLRTKLPTLWSNYFVSTVGGAPLAIIKQYIQNQKRSEPR